MKIKLIALAIITLLAQSICAQNIFKAIVKDGDTKEILVGVNAVLIIKPPMEQAQMKTE